jgi:hypothetical protein
VVLMDSASSCFSKRVFRVFGENRIIIIAFLVHKKYLFQALDFLLFGALKIVKKIAHDDFGTIRYRLVDKYMHQHPALSSEVRISRRLIFRVWILWKVK